MKILAGMPWRLDWQFTGLSNRTLEFFDEVARHGEEVSLYCAGPTMTSGTFSSHIIRIHSRSDGDVWTSLLNSIAFSSRFSEEVERLDYDVLHCFNTTSLFLSKRPYLFQTLNPTFAYAYEIMSQEYPHEPEFEKILDCYATVAQLERFEYQDSRVIVARSEAVKENIVRYHDVEPGRIHVIPDGVAHTGIPRSVVRNEPGKMKVVLFSGSIRIMKGFNYLIEAMEAVVREVPDVVLVAAGQIYRPDREIIMRKIKSSPVRHRVVMAGFLPPERYRLYLDWADVGCVPTVGHASLAVLECVSHGIPVVTTRFSGLQEINRVGIEVPPRDSDSIASALIEVLTNPELRVRTTRNGPTVLEKHNWRTTVRDFKKLYEQIAMD